MADDVAALRAEIARLEAVARHAAWSASIQALRAGAQGGEAHALRMQVAAMRSSQSFCSGFLKVARLPPQIELSSSSTAALPRIERGQLASSQAAVSARKVSRSLMVLTSPGT